MNTRRSKPIRRYLVAGVVFAGIVARLWAGDYFNNLTNLFVIGTDITYEIGDCQDLVAGGSYAIQFFTGDRATNAASFHLNWVAFEVLGNHLAEFQELQLPPWTDIQVELCQVLGTGSILMGQLGVPAIDPRTTQWPESADPQGCTTYVDFLPSTGICLQPNSEYSVSVSTTSTNTGVLVPTLLFALSTNYTATAGWRMGETTFLGDAGHIPGDVLKVAVDCTPATEPCSSGASPTNIPLSATHIGKKLSMIWPASPYVLYSTESLKAPAWTQIPTTPFRSNYNLVVSIPLTNNSQYFQLWAP